MPKPRGSAAPADGNPRRYGSPPYRVAVVHGGPGAAREMAPVAEELAHQVGVLEPLQTRDSVAGQVAELADQLAREADGPATLIGYSWGAWLAYLLAASHPGLVRKLILVSSGPFEERDAPQIAQTRAARMTADDKTLLQTLLTRAQDPNGLDRDALFAEVGAICERVDAYKPRRTASTEMRASWRICQRVWAEAARLRRSGELLARGTDIACPVVALHGAYDSHPAEGVREPLQRTLRDFRFILLERCGHTPWNEAEAHELFYRLLREELAGM